MPVLSEIFLMQASNKGYDPQTLQDKDFPLHEAYDAADEIYFLTFRTFHELNVIMKDKGIPAGKQDGSTGYFPQSDRESKTGQEKYEEDQILIWRFFTELTVVMCGVPAYPVVDEFFRGAKEMVETGQVPFYLAFAAQIFLDIHHLREEVGRAFGILEDNLRFYDKEIGEHLHFHENMRSDNWPPKYDVFIRRLREKLRWVLDDPVHHIKLKSSQAAGENPHPSILERNIMLKMSPVLSGLMLYRFRSEMYNIGINLANAWGSITYSLHLYNALQSEKLISERWKGIDTIRTLLGDSNFFVGNAPTTPADYSKKFHLQMGATVAAFSRNRRANAPLYSRSGARVIKHGVPVSRMFYDRYVKNTGQVDWKAEDVAQLIELGLDVFPHGPLSEAVKAQQKTTNGKKQPSLLAEMHPEFLVNGPLLMLQGEALEFAFPYMAMHRECWSLLRAVRKYCHVQLQESFTKSYRDQETELCCIVGFIFMTAGNKQMKLLWEAGIAVDEFLRSQGSGAVGSLGSQKGLGVPSQYLEKQKLRTET
ncbi:hypothetical protein GGR52DRAFT_535999 [Hypoxylon sp. FL1284]|nr:hypothetical protein GGR52DRAFT_535999 [Hypoxylon sp. FL1284]